MFHNKLLLNTTNHVKTKFSFFKINIRRNRILVRKKGLLIRINQIQILYHTQKTHSYYGKKDNFRIIYYKNND